MVVLRSPSRKLPRRPSLEGQSDAAEEPTAPALTAGTSQGARDQHESLLHMQAPSAISTSPEKPPASSSHARLVAQTLAHVAESPNLKRNAEWPFASSSKLRRSLPRAFVSSIPVLAKHQEMVQPAPGAVASDATIRTATEPETPTSNNKADDATPTSARHTFSQPLIDTHAASPEPARSNVARMSTGSRHACTSLPSSLGTPARTASPASPVSVRALAKIGRLTAQIAQLDSALSTKSAELAAVQAKHASASERLAHALAEGAKAREELEGHKTIAGDCEAILNEYEENKLVIGEIERLRETDALELAELQENHARLKWRERKVRCELASRRQEGKWREAEEHTDELREYRFAALALQATAIELERQLGCARFELACERATSAAHRAEADRLLAQRRDILLVVRDERGRMTAQAEQIATHHGERTELIARLDDAIRSAAHFEKDNKVIEKQLKLFEESEREHEEEAEQHQLVRSRLKEIEKQVKALERDNAQLLKSTAALEQDLADARADAELASKKLRESERRFQSAEEERKNLQGSFDMQQRASRAFGSASSSHSVVPASPETGRLAKSKAAQPIEDEESSDAVLQISEEEEEESIRLPPPLNATSAAAGPQVKAGRNVQTADHGRGKKTEAATASGTESEDADSAPPARATGKAAIKQKGRGGKGKGTRASAKGVAAVSRDERVGHITGSSQDEGQVEAALSEPVATKPKKANAHAARKTAPAAIKRKREEDTRSDSEGEADHASDDGSSNSEELRPIVKKIKKGEQKEEVVRTVTKVAASTTITTTSGSGSASTSTAPARKKINLSGKTGGAFSWGGLGAGGLSGGGGNILGIPDVLSPIKKGR